MQLSEAWLVLSTCVKVDRVTVLQDCAGYARESTESEGPVVRCD